MRIDKFNRFLANKVFRIIDQDIFDRIAAMDNITLGVEQLNCVGTLSLSVRTDHRLADRASNCLVGELCPIRTRTPNPAG
jgi:hypothetical protein